MEVKLPEIDINQRLKVILLFFSFYLSTTSLLFILHGWFLNVAIIFFFSSTCSFNASISPSDSDSPSDSEEEEEELLKGKTSHELLKGVESKL